MYGIIGNSWIYQYALPTQDFTAGRTIDSSCLTEITTGAAEDIGRLGTAPDPTDFYTWGLAVSRAARLASAKAFVCVPGLLTLCPGSSRTRWVARTSWRPRTTT